MRVGAEGNGEPLLIINIYRRVPRAGGGMLCLLQSSEFDELEKYYFITVAQQVPVGQGHLIIEDSWSHSFRHTTIARAPLDEWWARYRNLYLTTHSTHKRQTSMLPGRFEPPIPASEGPQTKALDRAATGIGCKPVMWEGYVSRVGYGKWIKLFKQKTQKTV